MSKKPTSDAHAAIYETMSALHDVGAIDDETLAEFDTGRLRSDDSVQAFLEFVARDLQSHPERAGALPDGLLDTIRALVAGMAVDLDAPLESDDDSVSDDGLLGGLQDHLPVDLEPEIDIARWRIMRAGTEDRVLGVTNGYTSGRISSPIVAFDPDAMTVTTQTGRLYRLRREPSWHKHSDWLWAQWTEARGITDAVDVTAEYWPGCAQRDW